MIWLKNVESVAVRQHNCTPANFKHLEYGTAGFRDKGSALHHVVFRMGILAALRSQYLGKAVGLMITASHNPMDDNGVKIVDPDGEMLAAEWELLATEMANSSQVAQTASKFAQQLKVNCNDVNSCYPLVVIGRDTRPSSNDLWKAAIEGISEAAMYPYIDCGVVTTPQLHFVVQKLNTDFATDLNKMSALPLSSLPSMYLDRYFDEVCGAFLSHVNISTESKQHVQLPKSVFVDCANGVGIFSLRKAAECVANVLTMVPVNSDHECHEKLNFQCGADFVKVQQKPPQGLEFSSGNRYASFDGDADRVVYYYLEKSTGQFRLLDGDKIATLLAGYIGDLLTKANLRSVLSMGLVQTAYANGSSTRYICEELKVPIVCVPTGVKHLHKAAKKFDIGVYFEANGHGTVLFSERACSVLSERSNVDKVDEATKACKKLHYLRQIINPAVGDALTDLLAVEAVLIDLDWSLEDWNMKYTDLPSRQLKVKVRDRSAITTENAERRCVKPLTLQPAIDELVKNAKFGRSFVRPSGTEDIVRIYAEAETQTGADWLAYDVAVAAFTYAGGIPPEPVQPDCERPVA